MRRGKAKYLPIVTAKKEWTRTRKDRRIDTDFFGSVCGSITTTHGTFEKISTHGPSNKIYLKGNQSHKESHVAFRKQVKSQRHASKFPQMWKAGSNEIEFLVVMAFPGIDRSNDEIYLAIMIVRERRGRYENENGIWRIAFIHQSAHASTRQPQTTWCISIEEKVHVVGNCAVEWKGVGWNWRRKDSPNNKMEREI